MGLAPVHRLKRALRPVTAATAAACLCACASPVGSPPFAKSPVSAEVKQASAASGRYPRFSEIPAAPLDVRPTRAWGNSIYDMLRLRRQMLVEAAMIPPPPADTEVFARSERNKTNPAAAGATSSANSTAAFVEGGRERATPPSPAN